MEEHEVWQEIQEATEKLNHYIRVACAKRLRVEVEVDNNLRAIELQHPIPRISVAVFKALKPDLHNPAGYHEIKRS